MVSDFCLNGPPGPSVQQYQGEPLGWAGDERAGGRDMDSVEVRLLGPLLVRRGDGSMVEADEWRTNEDARSVRLLALNSGRPMSVATVVDRLWPRVDWDRGRASLRTAASQLRKTLGADCIERRPARCVIGILVGHLGLHRPGARGRPGQTGRRRRTACVLDPPSRGALCGGSRGDLRRLGRRGLRLVPRAQAAHADRRRDRGTPAAGFATASTWPSGPVVWSSPRAWRAP